MVRRYAAGTAAGAAMVISLTGCLGDSGNGKTDAVNVSAAQAIDLASKKTGTIDSYKVDLTADGTGKASGKAHAVIQVRLHPSLAAIGNVDQISFGGNTVPAGERAILLGDNLYAKVPSQLSRFTGGKPWVRFSVSQAAQKAGVNLNDLLKRADPAEQTKIFTGSKDVHRVGSAKIDGVKTTHYQGSLTAKEAAEQLDPKARRSFRDLYQQADAKKIVFDLWVGADNLPRKLTSKVTTAEGSASTTMVYSGYNKSFSVSAPPASQVADGNGLASSWDHHGATPGRPG